MTACSPAHPCAEQPCLHRVLAECPRDQVVHLADLYGLLTATGKVARAGDLPPEPVETWHREIRALRSLTTLWDGVAAGDEDSVRRVLPQHQAAKGKNLLGLAREHLARRVTEKVAGGRLELIAPPDEGPVSVRDPPPAGKTHRRHLAAVRRRDRRHDRLRPLSGSRLRPMVSSERRSQ